MQTFAINICLIPDETTFEICEQLNKLDTWDYNTNTQKYIPHATLVMKSIDEEGLAFLKTEFEKFSLEKIHCKTLDYYCKDSPVWLWNGINIEKNSKIQQLQQQIIELTKNIENKPRTKESYVVQERFTEEWVKLKDETFFQNEKKIHITFWKNDIAQTFETSNFPKEVTFTKLVIGQMGNYGSVRKILFEIDLQNIF